MNWYIPCAYDDVQKRNFHATGRKRLKALATALGLEAGTFDLRSNLGGIAVSGEVTLHGERLYVQICQPATGVEAASSSAPAKAARTTPGDAITFCLSAG